MRSADPVRPGSIVICTGLPEPQVDMMLVYVLLLRYIAHVLCTTTPNSCKRITAKDYLGNGLPEDLTMTPVLTDIMRRVFFPCRS